MSGGEFGGKALANGEGIAPERVRAPKDIKVF